VTLLVAVLSAFGCGSATLVEDGGSGHDGSAGGGAGSARGGQGGAGGTAGAAGNTAGAAGGTAGAAGGTAGAAGGTAGAAGGGPSGSGGTGAAICTPNLACTTNPNRCKAGTTSCATGSSQCVDGVNLAAGASCGSSASTSCSGPDSCDGSGNCNVNNLPSGTDCGVCQQCNGSGVCAAGYEGTQDPTGCNTPQTCSGTTKTLAQTCSSGQCKAGATSSCANGCTGNDCTAGRCGDGTVQAPEQCDDGNTVTESCAYGLMSCVVCNSMCQQVNGAVSYCGDRVVQSAAGELCDDGNSSNLDLCSTGCKTCGILVGPALGMLSDDDGDQGLEFLVTANTTIVQFVSHNQGKPSNIVLRPVTAADVSARPILQRVQLPANLDSDGNTVAQNVTVNVSWPLTAGMTYTISDQEGSNSVFSAVSGGTYPDMSLPGIDIIGAWSAGDSDYNIPESTNTTYWMTFTGFHACLQ